MDIEKVLKGIFSYLQNEQNDMKQKFAKALRDKTDDELRRMRDSISSSDSRYPFVINEIHRRGL